MLGLYARVVAILHVSSLLIHTPCPVEQRRNVPSATPSKISNKRLRFEGPSASVLEGFGWGSDSFPFRPSYHFFFVHLSVNYEPSPRPCFLFFLPHSGTLSHLTHLPSTIFPPLYNAAAVPTLAQSHAHNVSVLAPQLG
jgi:hypothetical protein